MKSLISIDNKNMEVFQKGRYGIPILILTGMACSFEEWIEITDSLSVSGRVISFHRPGLGKREIGPEIRSSTQACKEIKSLLNHLDVTEPVLLIGHSYGGLIAQQYAKLHPNQVKGVILVDSTSDNLKQLDNLDLPVLNENASDEDWIQSCRNYARMTEKELENELQTKLSLTQQKLPTDVRQNLIDFQHKPELYQAMAGEVGNWKKDAEHIKTLGDLGQMPLTVIGRDRSQMIRLGVADGLPEAELEVLESAWEDLIREQAELSSGSLLIFAEGAGHSVHLDRPDVIIQAVTEMIRKFKL